MKEEKTSEEIMFNCGGKGFEINKKWIPSDKAKDIKIILVEENRLLKKELEDFKSKAILIEDVEYIINYGNQHNHHASKILRQIIIFIEIQKLKSRGRDV